MYLYRLKPYLDKFIIMSYSFDYYRSKLDLYKEKLTEDEKDHIFQFYISFIYARSP